MFIVEKRVICICLESETMQTMNALKQDVCRTQAADLAAKVSLTYDVVHDTTGTE